MLVIAIPKSASTSLLSTLGQLHGMPAEQTFFPEQPAPAEVKLLHRYHSDLREITAEQAELFRRSDRIFKQHLPPTEHNLQLLGDHKKVILLREPREIIEAYYRAEQRSLHASRPEFSDCRTVQDWHRTAEQNGLLEDLQWFHDEWTREAARRPGTCLILRHTELVADPKAAVNLIEAHTGLPVSGSVVLSKERYSRDPFYTRIGRRLVDALRRNPVCHSSLRLIKRRIIGTH